MSLSLSIYLSIYLSLYVLPCPVNSIVLLSPPHCVYSYTLSGRSLVHELVDRLDDSFRSGTRVNPTVSCNSVSLYCALKVLFCFLYVVFLYIFLLFVHSLIYSIYTFDTLLVFFFHLHLVDIFVRARWSKSWVVCFMYWPSVCLFFASNHYSSCGVIISHLPPSGRSSTNTQQHTAAAQWIIIIFHIH